MCKVLIKSPYPWEKSGSSGVSYLKCTEIETLDTHLFIDRVYLNVSVFVYNRVVMGIFD